MRALLLFVDGVGIGPANENNPLAAASIPVMRRLLGGAAPVLEAGRVTTEDASLVGLDATLGVDGTPQSGTGQATLFTGENAAALHGRHFGPWIPARLRSLVRERNILTRAASSGKGAAFANAYPRSLIDMMRDAPAQSRLPPFLRAGPPQCAAGAGVFTRDESDLHAGRAVASEIVNDGWRERFGLMSLPEVTPVEAGATLASIAAEQDITLFAHYATDSAGHDGNLAAAIHAIERLDGFLGGVIAHLPSDCVLVMASDHGNIEDMSTGHTRNDAICLIYGPQHAEIAAGMQSLADVAPALARVLQLD